MTTHPARHDGAAPAVRSSAPGADVVVGEARWPMASAVLAAMALTVALPDAERVGPRWMLPLIVGLLLVALALGDPGKIDRRSRGLRALSIVLASVLAQLHGRSARSDLVPNG